MLQSLWLESCPFEGIPFISTSFIWKSHLKWSLTHCGTDVSSKISSPGVLLKTKRSLPKYPYHEFASLDILIIQVLVTSANSSFAMDARSWRFYSLQAWWLSSSYVALTPLVQMSLHPQTLQAWLLTAFAPAVLLPRNLVVRVEKARILSAPSAVGLVCLPSPLVITVSSHLCWSPLAAETTSISLFTCLWSYSPGRESNLHERELDACNINSCLNA